MSNQLTKGLDRGQPGMGTPPWSDSGRATKVVGTGRSILQVLSRHGAYILLSAGIFALPLVYLAVQAFKPYTEFLRNPTGLPSGWTATNFSDAWQQGEFARQLVNSLVYASMPTAISILLGVFLAFPIARGYFKQTNLLYGLFVFSGFLPVGLIPLFIEAQALGLYNSMMGYVVMNSLVGAGFFFFVGYIRTIPRERDEAAAMDGCGYVRFILTIIIPEMKPALAAFGVFGFVAAWNNMILPLVMLADEDLWPVTRGLYSFLGENVQNWPLISAGIIIVAAPVVCVFVLAQRYLVEGVAGGAVAGGHAVAAQVSRNDG
ncbi:carbohydrate ABC transporter permease [Actinopolymorpha alba]|uniref:carbohydrate ABC transporter permease n=1 Tax=Actinopolymorpha alba TaxID=533267 RepID=UPI000399C1FC|nr:carbohydrate ABC transporter permease [Actinopolymorpha alba]